MNKATLGNEVAKLTLLNTFGLPDGKASRAEAVGDHLRLAGRLDPLRHHPHDPDLMFSQRLYIVTDLNRTTAQYQQSS